MSEHEPASKKRKDSSNFPDPLDMLTESRAAKKNAKVAFGALQSLNFFTVNTLKLSEDQKLAWLIVKYGWNEVSSVRLCLNSFPSSLTESQRESLFEKFYPEVIGFKEISSFLADHCPTFVSTSPRPPSNVLAPPVEECFECKASLTAYHTCEAELYTLSGVKVVSKVTLRCQHCRLLYNYSQFGNKSELGFRYYPQIQPVVEVTDTTFVERTLLEFQCNLANHSWVSFQGFAEAYNDTFLVEKEHEMTPKVVAKAFWIGEVEMELRRLGREDFRFHADKDLEMCMDMIEDIRRQSIYPHPESDCRTECKLRGCGKLWVTDGIWSLCYPHCMYQMQHTLRGIPQLNLPDVCTESPVRGHAFCSAHCKFIEEHHSEIPTGLRDFLKYCGIMCEAPETVNVESNISKVDEVVNALPSTEDIGKLAANSQGIEKLLTEHPSISEVSSVNDPTVQLCRKKTACPKRLRRWSRGHQFVVRGGGHINSWSPLYKSESPSQVFLILVQWLLSLVKQDGVDTALGATIAYDNMCNLDRLRAVQAPLPLPSPLDRMWKSITKIIDVFHFSNHIDADCRIKYSPEKVKELNPSWNTQAGEQTFVWLSRFKHIVCPMPKHHHLFFIHRMVVRRNAYTSKCYKHGRKPVLPKKAHNN